MGSIFIVHHDVYKFILEYQPGIGPTKQIKRIDLPREAKTDKGFYVEVNNVFIGIFASKEGPVFFYDKKDFFLSDRLYDRA